MDKMGIFNTWSRQSYITLDGEIQQLNTLLTPTMVEKFRALHCEFHKYPSACSGVLQPNDLSRMHSIMHAMVPSAKNMAHSYGQDVQRYVLDTVSNNLWKANERPAQNKIKQWAHLLGSFKVVAPSAMHHDVVRKGQNSLISCLISTMQTVSHATYKAYKIHKDGRRLDRRSMTTWTSGRWPKVLPLP